MGKRKVGALEKVDADLSNLQYKIRRDPASYAEDFEKQYRQYESQREIFMRAPSSASDSGIVSLRDLIDFVAHLADSFPQVAATFPQELMDMLSQHHAELDSELREKIVGSLVLLRRKKVLDSPRLLQALFPILLSTPSKSLRRLLYQKILANLRTSNAKTTDHKLNRTIQAVLFDLLTSDRTSSKGLWAVKITRELWRRQVWIESKAVEVMKEASLADNVKVVAGGVRFFLGGDKEREELEDESSDEEKVDIGKIKHQMAIKKKTKKQARALEHATQVVKKKERKRHQPHPLNFSAFHLLHDPQGFAEELFSKHLQHARSKLSLEQKIPVLQLVSRLVGLHKLAILGLYSYLIKYLTPRQPMVTSFLAALAQASHSLVPPDVLEPLVHKIANEFVSEAAASEVASAGLNAIREICLRQPLAMTDTLLQDLVMYRKSKDKGVVMAAKGLLSLYREVNADMLKRKDRGKEATMGLLRGDRKERRYGEEEAGQIDGLELLEQWKDEEKKRKRQAKGLASDEQNGEESDSEDGWEVGSVGSHDSGRWMDLPSDADIAISDSDDERRAKRVKREAQLDNSKISPLESSQKDGEPSEANEPANLSTVDSSSATIKLSSLATSQILTPADLAKLHELRLAAQLDGALPSSQRRRVLAAPESTSSGRHPDDALTSASIEGLTAQRRAAKEAQRADADEHSGPRSTQAKRAARKAAAGKSSTNADKARRKNFLMTLGLGKRKQRRSLVERGKTLKAHVERAKRGGKRGNRGSK